MTISAHMQSFAGKPIVDWEPASHFADPAGSLPRLSLAYGEGDDDQKWTDLFAAFLDQPGSGEVTGLVAGLWDLDLADGESSPVIEALVAARDRLPHLTALFIGDVTYEECEISWLRQSDLSPLFQAYPALQHFGARGGEGLRLGRLSHDRLQTLIIESGGLGAEVVRSVAAAQLPALEHLELWLGIPDYGGDATVADLAPILSGTVLPRLSYLGLRDSEIADEIARAVAVAPILERIQTLDLSLGTLSDDGAAALLQAPAVARLKKLDLHHHYCSDEMVARLKTLGIEVDAGDQQTPDQYDGVTERYVAVGE